MNNRRVLFASLIGTTIEFFDFFIYGIAAVLVFPRLFFTASDPATATLQSFATFSIAFFARPLGSIFFGHFGDKFGRKKTLIATLLTMGISTVAIGLLPTYQSIGVIAPLLLALCRFGQGIGLGGEWGGAVLLAIENASDSRKRIWYGIFPQLGAPLGFIISNGMFLVLSQLMSEESFLAWGWRLPFVSSALLVFLGLYIRLSLVETHDFLAAVDKQKPPKTPIADLFRSHLATWILATLTATTTFAIFYLLTVFTLSWGTSQLGFSRNTFLLMQIIGITFLGMMIPISAISASRIGRIPTIIVATLAVIVFGLVFGPMFSQASTVNITFMLSLGFAVMGLTYGSLGSVLGDLFPTSVRYTGASFAFSAAGVLGGSIAPYAATWLAGNYGINAVGYYVSAVGIISLAALLILSRREPA